MGRLLFESRRGRAGWSRGGFAALALGLWLAGALASAQAQYKIVGPDKHVTYTDRPPAGANAVPLRGGAPADDGPALPYALAQVVARYPVTLITAASDCAPCVTAREALRQRGVPHREVTVRPQDLAELERRENAREVPILRVGGQQLVGWQAAEWQRYLDLAGYPGSSALPAGYRWPAAQPLVGEVPKPMATTREAAPPLPTETPTQPADGKRFRF